MNQANFLATTLKIFWVMPLLMLSTVNNSFAQSDAVQTYVQDSPAASELLMSVKDRLSKEEPAEAARIVQKILKQYSRKLISISDGKYREVRVVVEQTLIDNPKLLEFYRQLYEPEAAKRLADAGRDVRLLGKNLELYGLTDAGLESAFRLAGLLLEQDEPKAAVNLLNVLHAHPSMPRFAGRWQYLRATAALYANNQPLYKQARAVLQEASHDKYLKQLDTLKQTVQQPLRSEFLHPFDVLPKANVPESFEQPLWTQQYPTISSEAQNDTASNSGDARHVSMVPVAMGSTVFGSNGQKIYALDRSSGLKVWEYDAGVTGVNVYRNNNVNTTNNLTFVEADGRHVLAVMGQGPMVTAYSYYSRSSQSYLTCLDAQNGKRLWVTTPANINDSLKNAFWYGRPIAARGRVYVMLRERSRTQFRHAYVAALNIRDGSLAWLRHIVSTEMPDRQTVPEMNQMLFDQGWLYIDSGMGAVARVSVSDGGVDWLSVKPPASRLTPYRQAYPWQTGIPVLTEAGLVVHDQWGDTIRVFNQDTGQVIKQYEEREFGYPNYLLPAGPDILAIGSSVKRIRVQDGTVLWEVKHNDEPAGRATIAGSHVYLPYRNGLVIVDLNTGKTISDLKNLKGGNLLALDGQLVAAHPNGLACYSTWDFVVKYLQDRIQQQPLDPVPHLSMSWLAYRSKKPQQLISSVDSVIKLTGEDESRIILRKRLFGLLMRVVNDDTLADAALKQSLFERLGLATTNTTEEVQYRLALGMFHQQSNRIQPALEQYQLILSQREYAHEKYTHNGGSRQAGLEAQRRIAALIDKNGRSIYSRYDLFAAQRLKELESTADPEPLEELARAYPLAGVAPLALHAAAQRHVQKDQIRTAVSLLHRATQLTDDKTQIALIVSLQTQLYEQMQQVSRARRLLLRHQSKYPNVLLTYQGQQVTVASWLARLELKTDFKSSFPSVSFPLNTKPQLIPGRILTGSALTQTDAMPNGRMMLKTLDHFELWDIENAKLLWKHKMEDAAVRMLSMTSESIWLWYPVAKRMELINAKNGEAIYTTGNIEEHFDKVPNQDPVPNANNDDGRAEINRRIAFAQARRRREPTFSAGLSEIACVDQYGRILMFDATTGKPIWQLKGSIDSPQMVINRGEYFVVAGIGQSLNRGVPIINVYDSATGRRILQQKFKPEDKLQWVQVNDEGQLIAHTSEEIYMIDLTTGQMVWQCNPEVNLTTYGTQIMGDRLVVYTNQRDLLWVNLADGQVINRYPLRQFNSVRFQIEAVEKRWFVVMQGGILAFDHDGNLLWRDAIEDNKRIIRHGLTDQYVLVMNILEANDVIPRNTRRLLVLDQVTGSIVYQLDVHSSGTVDQLMVFNKKVVFGSLQNIAIFDQN